MTRIAIIFFSLILCSCQNSDTAQIRMQLNGMEEAWRKGDKLGVAQFYSDDGYLISSGEMRAHGREEINEYWEGFTKEPVDWILTDIVTSNNKDDIVKSARYKPENLEIPNFESLNIDLPNDVFYQFGTSELIWESNGKQDTGTVSFFLVWKRVNDTYRIYIDAYN